MMEARRVRAVIPAAPPKATPMQIARAILAGVCIGAAMWGLWYGMNGPQKATVSGADLGGAHIARMSFSSSDLRATNFANSVLDGALLRGDCLSAANLASTHLRSADLRAADLRSANLAESDLEGSDLTGADFRNANLAGARLWGCTLCGADFRNANLLTADLRDAKYDAATRWPDGISPTRLGARFFRSAKPIRTKRQVLAARERP